MALFKYLTKEKAIKKGFTHKGKLFGVPVFIADLDSPAPEIIAGNFVPEWVLDIAEALYFTVEAYVERDNPEYEPGYKILVTEELKPDGE
ncbi:hypothetical protein IFE17_09885 [Actinobacillus sp. GY-402]|nr:hypothetical protein IFE17_09265 [Actinobacillus sp. GY-402]QOF67431.1 hypothetical protein IFE17_09885 [Actinobacillus sp. GY-402]